MVLKLGLALVTSGVYAGVSLVACAAVVRVVLGPEPTTGSLLLLATGTCACTWTLDVLVRRWAGRRLRHHRPTPSGLGTTGQVAAVHRGARVPCHPGRSLTHPRASTRHRGLLVDGFRQRALARVHDAQAGPAEDPRRCAPDPGYAPLADPAPCPAPAPAAAGDTPLIIDTDIGGDPDDAVAFVLAARLVPRLALVLTSDEQDGQRARFARHLPDLLGRGDVPVVAGRALDPTGWLSCVDGLVPAGVPAQPADVVAAVAAVRQAAAGPVRWLGCGPMSNLALVLAQLPEVNSGLRVTQMGGALPYRDPARADHNLRRDVPAARYALATLHRRPLLVTSDVAYTEQTAIAAGSPAYQRLTASQQPGWPQLLHAHSTGGSPATTRSPCSTTRWRWPPRCGCRSWNSTWTASVSRCAGAPAWPRTGTRCSTAARPTTRLFGDGSPPASTPDNSTGSGQSPSTMVTRERLHVHTRIHRHRRSHDPAPGGPGRRPGRR
jgi:hypothetical protein